MYNNKSISSSFVTEFKNNAGVGSQLGSLKMIKNGSEVKEVGKVVDNKEEKKVQKDQEDREDEDEKVQGRRNTFIDHLVDDDCVDFEDFVE